MNKHTLNFLGRGSMFNVKEGNTSAFYKTKDGKSMLLIDCGGTTYQRICDLNLLDGLENITILITHTHTDHVGSLPDLLFHLKFICPHIKIKLVGPKQSLLVFLNASGVLRELTDNEIDKNYYKKYTTNTKDEVPYIPKQTNIYPVSDYDLDQERVNYGMISLFLDDNFRGDTDEPFNYCAFSDETHMVFSYLPEVNEDYYSVSYLIWINELKKLIYYSGDTKKIPTFILLHPLTGTVKVKDEDGEMSYRTSSLGIDEFYIDSAVRESSDGVTEYPHNNIYKFNKKLQHVRRINGGKYPPENSIYGIHLDDDETIEACEKLGITPVSNIILSV